MLSSLGGCEFSRQAHRSFAQVSPHAAAVNSKRSGTELGCPKVGTLASNQNVAAGTNQLSMCLDKSHTTTIHQSIMCSRQRTEFNRQSNLSRLPHPAFLFIPRNRQGFRPGLLTAQMPWSCSNLISKCPATVRPHFMITKLDKVREKIWCIITYYLLR